MAKVTKRTFSLTEEQAAFIERKVASGGYASGSEVVREGLREMQQRDEALEIWLRNEVLPAIEEYDADPSKGVTSSELRRRFKEWYAASVKDAAE